MPAILIIDDSELIRNRVQEILRNAAVGTLFLTAPNGIEGMKVLSSHTVNLVVCDVVMPGIDGFKFLRLMRSNPLYQQIPVLMLTGNEDVQAKIKCFENGAADYVTKPFHTEELVARIKVHLQLQQLRAELEQKNANLEYLSRIDPLTQVANRRDFLERFEQEISRAHRHTHSLGCMLIDIDHFKKVNDAYGHATGDRALVAVAHALQKDLRAHDILCRYGGEEFAALLVESSLEESKTVAERCRAKVEALALEHENTPVSLTVSLGVCAFPTNQVDSPEGLLTLADKALYRAKNEGRNRVCVSEAPRL